MPGPAAEGKGFGDALAPNTSGLCTASAAVPRDSVLAAVSLRTSIYVKKKDKPAWQCLPCPAWGLLGMGCVAGGDEPSVTTQTQPAAPGTKGAEPLEVQPLLFHFISAFQAAFIP